MAELVENEDNLNIFDDIDINLDIFDKDGPMWDSLIDKIIDGNVVPIIGSNVLLNDKMSPHEYIVKVIAKKLGLKANPSTFSELAFDNDFKTKCKKDDLLYYYVNQISSQISSQNLFVPSEILKRFLSIRQFPFVITTSFVPIVEQIMRDIWKDELKVMRFTNNPQKNDDIRDDKDLRKPTVFYMFGKVGDGAREYVLTDTDMLNFCSSWLTHDNKVRPKNLCNALKDKYLLMLGNNYSDWLFRFIWFSMRKQDMGNGMLMYEEKTIDESLISFLMRVDAFLQQNPSEVVDQIVSRLNKKLLNNEKTKFNKPEEYKDIFISYSRRDKAIAIKLYDALTTKGKKVWFDKNDLTSGGNFRDEINRAIDTAEYFVPILTNNVLNEKNESHVYRNEWNRAINVAISMGRTYIIPVAEDGFDFYSAAIPENLQQHNAIFFSMNEDIEKLADSIIHKMNQD